MHECLLCKRDMKKSKDIFGKGCLKNIYNFLDLSIPRKTKNKELYLYNNIMKKQRLTYLNKDQKIWLTDRYLTYKYLDEIPYGNFDNIKNQINTDIKNVKKVNKFEEFITSSKIKLKEVYDLYKKVQKFDEALEKLKHGEINNEETIKLIIANCSFIFNMKKNQSQYEKNSFKAMQYAFWQTVIEVGGKYAEFDISADFLQHSLEKNPEDLHFTEGKVVDEINKDNQFKKTINEIVKKYGNNCNEFLFDSKKDEDFPMAFNNGDLYFAIHNANIKILGKRQNDKWNLEISLDDIYDYSDFKYINKYYKDTASIPKSIFSSTLYNLAYYSMKFGVMKEYNIDIHIVIDNFEVMHE